MSWPCAPPGCWCVLRAVVVCSSRQLLCPARAFKSVLRPSLICAGMGGSSCAWNHTSQHTALLLCPLLAPRCAQLGVMCRNVSSDAGLLITQQPSQVRESSGEVISQQEPVKRCQVTGPGRYQISQLSKTWTTIKSTSTKQLWPAQGTCALQYGGLEPNSGLSTTFCTGNGGSAVGGGGKKIKNKILINI